MAPEPPKSLGVSLDDRRDDAARPRGDGAGARVGEVCGVALCCCRNSPGQG